MHNHKLWIGIGLAIIFTFASRALIAAQPQLLATLPEYCPTPDGMAIDQDGNLVVACPNFADTKYPGCLIRIDRQGQVSKWVDVPVLAETGRACPMGIALGPDGDVYICDNQNWGTGNGKQGEINQGRLLRLRIREGQIQHITVIASGISHPNGVRVYQGHAYITVSMLPKVKRSDGLLTSAVYRFNLGDHNVAVDNVLDDKNLLVSFVTKNRDCQYGVDGLVFNRRGELFVGNFGDGEISKIVFDAEGRVQYNKVFAKTDFCTPMSDPQFREKMVRARMRTTDGICIDDQDNLYVADFSNNAVCKVSPQGHITVLSQNGDTDGSDGGLDQPGEPMLWDGRLVVTCFDMVIGPDKVNTRHDKPYTISRIPLER